MLISLTSFLSLSVRVLIGIYDRSLDNPKQWKLLMDSKTLSDIMKPDVVMLTQQEEYELTSGLKEAIEQGDEKTADKLLRELILQYTPIVRRIVKELSGYNQSQEDLYSQGLLALCETALRYDPDFQQDGHRIRFSAYATSWVRGMLFSYITKNFSIVNACTSATNKKLFFSVRRLMKKYHKTGSSFELTYEMAEQIAKDHNTTVDMVLDMFNQLRSPYESLHELVTNPTGEGTTSKEELLIDDSIDTHGDTETKDAQFYQKTLIEDALEILTPRERTILRDQRLRTGPESRTLEDLGEEFSISKERVRQIRDKAFSKVQNHIKTVVEQKGLHHTDLL